MKKWVAIVFVSLLGLGRAMSPIPVAFAEAAIVDVGNTICPVSGDKVSGKHFVEHQGKRYGLCCAHCKKEFSKDPEKYVAALAESAGEAHGGHSHEGHPH